MFEDIFKEACEAADKAFTECVPTPMVVGRAVGLFGNAIVPGTEEYVADGMCGFAWVNVKPANSKFVKWLKSRNIGSKSVYTGWTISFYSICPQHTGSQSYERKSAGACAFVSVIRKYYPDMKIWAESRLD